MQIARARIRSDEGTAGVGTDGPFVSDLVSFVPLTVSASPLCGQLRSVRPERICKRSMTIRFFRFYSWSESTYIGCRSWS